MKNQIICKNCSTKFSGASDADCPACAQHFASLLMSKNGNVPLDVQSDSFEAKELPIISKSKKTTPKINSENVTLADLLEAQNKTTHAVRALAVFFFTWLKVSIFGAIAYFVGVWIYDSFESAIFGAVLVVAGGLTTFIGFFVALNNGLDELERSKP